MSNGLKPRPCKHRMEKVIFQLQPQGSDQLFRTSGKCTQRKNTNTCSLLTVSFRDFPRFTPGLEKMKGFRLFRACVYPDQMSGAVSVRLVPPDIVEPRQTRFLVIMAASIDCTLHFTNQYGLRECHRRLSGVQPQILKTQ